MIAGVYLLAAVACSSGSEADDGPPLPELTPFSPAQAEQVHAIRDGIAATRGLSPVETIREGTISRDQWKDYNNQGSESLSDEERAALEFYNEVWRLMRLIGPDDDLLEASDETSDAIVVGFYQFKDEALVLIDDDSDAPLSLDDESTLSHEYVHSFQDGRFDMDALNERFSPEEDTVSELGTTIGCVIEGDAQLASDLYMDEEHGEGWYLDAATQSLEEIAEMIRALAEIPPIILEYSSFNYVQCEDFVRHVQAEQGWAGVDAMYEDPPTTTEQVLHPEKYLSREGAVALPDTDLGPALGKGWERDEVSAFGEFDVFAFFKASGAGEGDAGRAADGWAGGRTATYRQGKGDGALVHITLRWDTKADFDDFGVALWYALGWQGWQVSDGGDHWYWWDGDDAGYALGEEATLQYDLIFANDATAAGVAKAALQGGLAVKPDQEQ